MWKRGKVWYYKLPDIKHYLSTGQTTRRAAENYVIEVPLKHALGWIIERIEFIDENQTKLAKESSWFWSETSLSDILYIKKLGFLRIPE